MRRPKKYGSGEAAQYITRRAAVRKLQLSLNDFRRLCIIKGVYPREPKHRRRAQKGSSEVKILYHAKDIRFLLHEPIVWTLRDYKIFAKKSNRDRAIKDFKNLKRRLALYPELKIDHIVKERYPTFIDAIKDLDDCLTLLFLFSTFPSLRLIPREQSLLCRRLTIEFLHYIIASKSLRKVFISIKGYYFQANIKGQDVTWILPHYYPFKPETKSEVDFKLMSIFVEFYTIMLGFVNFRLYNDINLVYPPQLFTSVHEKDGELTTEDPINEGEYVSQRIAALNTDVSSIHATIDNAEDNLDQEADMELLLPNENQKSLLKLKEDAQKVSRLQKLFHGLKFFLSREVPREPMVILIRSFGGKVSWDSTLFPGSTFQENDETINYQIIDRPNCNKQYISRDYVQPQWVFDCVNRRELLPTHKYLMGVELPPHLSPFQNYQFHENDEEQNELTAATIELNQTKEDCNNGLEMEEEEKEKEQPTLEPDESTEEKEPKKEPHNMSVKEGKVHREDKRQIRKNNVEEHRLQARMVKPRHRNLFRKLIREKQAKEKEEWLLKKKRRIHQEKKRTAVIETA